MQIEKAMYCGFGGKFDYCIKLTHGRRKLILHIA